MSEQNHLSVRLKPEEIERIDAVRADLSTEWHPATWSDVLRFLVLAGLKAHEEGKRKPTGKTRRPARKKTRGETA